MIGYRATMSGGRVCWMTNPNMYAEEAEKIIRCEVVTVQKVEPGVSGYLSATGKDLYIVTAGPVPVDNVEDGDIVATASWGLLIRKAFETNDYHHIVVSRNWSLFVPVERVL